MHGQPEHAYAVVDVETTGLNPLRERVIEIGVLLLDPALELEGSWSTLINPERHVTASHVHGIYDADLIAAPLFRDVTDQLTALLEGRIFVAHNAHFDQDFINREFARARLYHTIYGTNLVDTLDQSRIYCPPGSHSLLGLAQRLGLATQQDHRALSDARIAADLLRYYVGAEAAAQRYAESALNRDGQTVLPAQWRSATPMHFPHSL